jgi:hypothetical protein
MHNNKTTITLHCKEDPIYLFPEMKLRILSPNFHIHISASDLYIPTIRRSVLLQKIGGPILGIYKSDRSQKHECGN